MAPVRKKEIDTTMRIDVVFASTGRAEILGQTIARLGSQTRPPDRVVVVGADEADLPLIGASKLNVVLFTARRGSCCQRNAGLDYIANKGQIVIFFDDDFIPADNYLEQVEEIFTTDPEIVGVTGNLMADGAHTGSLSFEQGLAILEGPSPRPAAPDEATSWLYGCNMAIRYEAARELRFDEALPLYGWQEDVDYSSNLSNYGKLVRTSKLTGVHLGTLRGRTSGLRFGYSQIANILYLRRKGTIRPSHGWPLMVRNVIANIVLSLRPEPLIDRRGRLRGNIRAIKDFFLGRLHPGRIESL